MISFHLHLPSSHESGAHSGVQLQLCRPNKPLSKHNHSHCVCLLGAAEHPDPTLITLTIFGIATSFTFALYCHNWTWKP